MVGTNERTVPSKDEVSLVKLVIKASFRSRFKLLFASSSDREKANFSRIRFYKFWRSCLGERCELFFKAFCEDIDLLKLFITLFFSDVLVSENKFEEPWRYLFTGIFKFI